jgi:hypothetical protein
MKPIATGVISVVTCVACFFATVKDGGNIDFYWKPLLAIWYAATLAAFLIRRPVMLASIKKAWWLQIAVPVVLFSVSMILVRIYEPNPLPAGPLP